MIIDYDEKGVASVNTEGMTERDYVLMQVKGRLYWKYLDRDEGTVNYPPDSQLISMEAMHASKCMNKVLAPGRPAGPIQSQCIAYRMLCWSVLAAEKKAQALTK
jgi:hypothetical protein